jgi:hypothetical protein
MAMTLIATNPDSTDVASISFTSSIDSTYKLYIFKFYDINPATDGASFQFQGNASSQSGYNETITSTSFRAYNNEAGSDTALGYYTSTDQAEGTGFQTLMETMGNGTDESGVGELFLFNPSNTTYVKHFYAEINEYQQSDYSMQYFTAGYFNVTAAITDIQFKMSSGNMDGVIKMYGVG